MCNIVGCLWPDIFWDMNMQVLVVSLISPCMCVGLRVRVLLLAACGQICLWDMNMQVLVVLLLVRVCAHVHVCV